MRIRMLENESVRWRYRLHSREAEAKEGARNESKVQFPGNTKGTYALAL